MKRRIGSKTIIKLLKKGIRHHDLPGATYIGGGCFRSAYRIGKWVVKETSDNEHSSSKDQCHIPRSVAQRTIDRHAIPMKLAPTTYVRTHGRRYMLQSYVRPVMEYGVKRIEEFDRFMKQFEVPSADGYAYLPLDLHCENVGYGSRGELVSFDW